MYILVIPLYLPKVACYTLIPCYRIKGSLTTLNNIPLTTTLTNLPTQNQHAIGNLVFHMFILCTLHKPVVSFSDPNGLESVVFLL